MNAPAPVSAEPIALLPWPVVAGRVGLSRSTVWRAIQAGTFPRAILIGSRRLWRSHDIDQWIANVSRAAAAQVTDRAAAARRTLAAKRLAAKLNP